MRRDIDGRITFFNEFAQDFFGYRKEEILGKMSIGTIVPEVERSGRDLKEMIEDIGKHPERYTNNENENMRANGERVWIAWTNSRSGMKMDRSRKSYALVTISPNVR